MPAIKPSAVSSLAQKAETQLFTDFPQHSGVLQTILTQRFPTRTESQNKLQFHSVKTNLTPEELESVLNKLQELSQLPGLTLESETQLYLEQQLADLLGFEVGTSSNGVSLPFSKGRIDSLPHLLSTPTQKDAPATFIPEAGVAPQRSVFGWNTPSETDIDDYSSRFWVALPLRSLVPTGRSYADTKQWAHKRKVLVINPRDALFCVAEIMDEYTDTTNRYQCGGSPTVIRNGKFWSPHNLGNVLLFLVEDLRGTVAPGMYQPLTYNS